MELHEGSQDAEHQPSLSIRPTSLNWTLDGLLSIGTNFVPVTRVSASLPQEKLSEIISHHEHKGIPLIIEGWHLREGWDSDLLSPDWLARKFTERQGPNLIVQYDLLTAPTSAQNVWDVYAQEDKTMAISELLDVYRKSNEYAQEFGMHHFTSSGKLRIKTIELENERLYGKDIKFPPEWYEQINALPSECLPFRDGDAFAFMSAEVSFRYFLYYPVVLNIIAAGPA